jgi:hypothetical protein
MAPGATRVRQHPMYEPERRDQSAYRRRLTSCYSRDALALGPVLAASEPYRN